MRFDVEEFGEIGRTRHGNPSFYKLLESLAELHDRKSHDYASDNNPSGNYHFAGQISAMFSHSPEDAGFAGRIAEKIYRLANLGSGGKEPKNESVEDTERDICVITLLWMTDRQERRVRSNRLLPDPTKAEARNIREEASERAADTVYAQHGAVLPYEQEALNVMKQMAAMMNRFLQLKPPAHTGIY